MWRIIFMSNEQFCRDYRITDSELTVFTQHICDSMTRDLTLFANYGITAANVTTMQSMCDAFEVFPTDDYIHQEYLSAVELRDNLTNSLHVIIRSMALRVELKWGKSSPKYKSLGIADLSKLPIESYITRARMLHAFMTEHLLELSAEGLTVDMLEDMEELINHLDDAIRDTLEKSSYRMEKTTERITNGNKLYDLMSKYCEIGKRIWDKVNPAFYNDYVIYSPGPGGLAAPKNLSFSYETNTLSWDEVANATSYQLEANTGSGFVEIYSGSAIFYQYNPSDGKTIYRVRAHNSIGYGNYSDQIEVWYYDVMPAPTNLSVKLSPTIPNNIELDWDAVPSADCYVVYHSQVGIGQPSGIFVGNMADIPNHFEKIVAPNYRYYFKVISCCWDKTSGYSQTVFIDIYA